MAEAVRSRPVEYYNPRPLILGICFFWGIVMGFGLYFFRAPEQIAQPAVQSPPPATEIPAAPGTGRNEGVPTITSVEPMTGAPARPNLMTMELDPPLAVMTTEGGLTGRNATPPTRASAGAGAAAIGRRPTLTSPPPLPDLMP